MKESKSVNIEFCSEKYSESIEIGYNEEHRFHAVIKTGDNHCKRGIILDRNGMLINQFRFNAYEYLGDISAAEYLEGFLEAHMYDSLYDALLVVKKNRNTISN